MCCFTKLDLCHLKSYYKTDIDHQHTHYVIADGTEW